MRKKKVADKPFDGGFDVKALLEALASIEEERSISQEETLEILRQSFEKAYKDWTDPINSDDLLAKAVLDLDNGRIHVLDIKNVVNEVEDDLIEIEVDEAKKINPELEAGDQLETEFDFSKLDSMEMTPFIRKIANIFKQKMIEANKAALLNKFKSQIGHLITGEVEKIENANNSAYISLSFGKTTGFLTSKNIIPGERFTLGDMVKVYLEGVGEKAKNPQLLITRTNDKFLMKLFEEEIHDIYDGTVVIKKISRDPGIRSKVAVYTTNPNVDPTGACVGMDGNRIRNICAQLSGEKIDVIKYIENTPLFIVEALKPANVVGVKINDDDSRTAIAVVKNGESKVAIGKKGVNVRLASKLVGLSIDVKELDEAMKNKISYRTIEDIKKEESANRLNFAEENNPDVMVDYDDEDEFDIDDNVVADVDESTIEASDIVASREETVPELSTGAKEPQVIITAKPKISLSDLEKQIEEEKKKSKEVVAPRKKYVKNKNVKPEEEEEEVVVKKPEPVVPVMPIYTEEELAQLESEESDEVDTELFDEFDDDEFYDDDDSGKDSWHF